MDGILVRSLCEGMLTVSKAAWRAIRGRARSEAFHLHTCWCDGGSYTDLYQEIRSKQQHGKEERARKL
jgi:hypothetical protein